MVCAKLKQSILIIKISCLSQLASVAARKIDVSWLAQWKSAGLITRKSSDRNGGQLFFFIFIYSPFTSGSCVLQPFHTKCRSFIRLRDYFPHLRTALSNISCNNLLSLGSLSHKNSQTTPFRSRLPMRR